MKTMLKTMLFCTLLAPACAYAVPSTYPTGVTFYNPEKAYNGYTVIAYGTPRIVDMNGNLVKEWKGGYDGFPNKALPGGLMMTTGKGWKDGQQDKLFVATLDFAGNKVWEFRNWQDVPAIEGQPQADGKTSIARQHHDFQRKDTPVYYTPDFAAKLPDAAETTLILSHTNERVDKINPNVQLVTDMLLETDKDGNVTWSWKISDHLDELGFDENAFKAMNTFPPADNPAAGRHGTVFKGGQGYDWMHINCASYLGPNKWFKEDPVKYAAFNPSNIIINSRDANMMCIVSRETGAVVWRLGPDFAPGTEDFKVGQIVGAHGVHIIPEGLPGEGNVLFFDNGGLGGYGAPTPDRPVSGFHNVQRPYSRVVEFNPVTKEKVWEYDWFKNHKGARGHMDFKFFSPFVSYAQRLPNGNTLVTEGDMARSFELTPEFEMVWEYMSPYSSETVDILYRTYRIGYEWMPEAVHADEVAVVPPNNELFVLPNVNGDYPDLGKEGEIVKAGGDDDAQPSMHSY
ncbi:MAG: aryl-sulfate sulfotransferase [Mailhella sp.]|nr:aryl-sulfate sulfotransferase [Mailhella sp.]